MGKRGPAPRPGAVKRLEGERPQRINDNEPVPEDAPPQDFKHFNEEQNAMYDEYRRQLGYMGIAKSADTARLVALVYAEWTCQDCIRRVNETGLLVRAANGEPKANPLLAVQERASARATVLAREFGFTPSSRQAIVKEPKVPEVQRPESTRRAVRKGNVPVVTDLFG